MFSTSDQTTQVNPTHSHSSFSSHNRWSSLQMRLDVNDHLCCGCYHSERNLNKPLATIKLTNYKLPKSGGEGRRSAKSFEQQGYPEATDATAARSVSSLLLSASQPLPQLHPPFGRNPIVASSRRRVDRDSTPWNANHIPTQAPKSLSVWEQERRENVLDREKLNDRARVCGA